MYLYHNIENDLVINVEQIHARQKLIQKIKQRFATFGYQEIITSTFEQYDLYAKMNGTVNHQEMIKTIDNTGQVLVLRPDVTIPITQQIALHNNELREDLRYFYVQDVFRQAAETKDHRESTQAGVEYFGNPSPQADAEIIALAIQMLQDIQVNNFKIELGHAGFFKQLVTDMNLEKQDLSELKQYIQAKNVTEIEQFLNRLSVDSEVKKVVSTLPFLYGNPLEVILKANNLPLNDEMKNTLQNLKNIYDVLDAYGVVKNVVIDLSLINHMDYYSDMIFQGFIEKVGKPIIMGGRYNTLANQFHSNLPAIGFACDVNLLIEGIDNTTLPSIQPVDIVVTFNQQEEQQGLQLASKLRNENFTVLTYLDSQEKSRIPISTFSIHIKENENILIMKDKQLPFSNAEDVLSLLHRVKERR
ncbi:ATP phosphoribosyltransferase regulatory subunit [Pseudogracilibacillus sp. SE30717A]|uniref:ATP phosphoribosyltransferase regulatory subunit n=1 Tax=Pseudogracilibacillus sp. SE30717A TaxID=3098293 RepID=UPI00300DF2A6